jgi:hypothetical protein
MKNKIVISQWLARLSVWLILFALVSGNVSAVRAQNVENLPTELILPRPQPPMQNVFFNVLWGSLTGGMLMTGWATVDDSETERVRYSVSYLSDQFLTGATYGGILGLVAGVYLSLKEITFDENLSRIAFFPLKRPNSQPALHLANSAPRSIDRDFGLIEFRLRF